MVSIRSLCERLVFIRLSGILPHDGKNIQFKEIGKLIRTTYNFSPTFCYFVPKFAADMLNKDYNKDTFDLKELDLHNGIEHDASFCRQDTALSSDQSEIHHGYIKELLASATGKDRDGNPIIMINDLSKFSAKRRVDARETNPDFTLDFAHRLFASSNASTLLTIFGGRVKDLETILLEERLPEGWESRVRRRFGLTLAQINLSKTLWVEYGVDEKKYIQEKAAAQAKVAATIDANEEDTSIQKVDAPMH